MRADACSRAIRVHSALMRDTRVHGAPIADRPMRKAPRACVMRAMILNGFPGAIGIGAAAPLKNHAPNFWRSPLLLRDRAPNFRRVAP